MKIGIITILKVDNYGADLQAFALQRKLELMGYDSEIIDYLYYKNNDYKREKESKVCFKYPLKLILREYALKMLDVFNHIRFRKKYEKRKIEFFKFHKDNTKMTRCYKSYSELYNQPPLCDVYCVGSDQVWNPGNYTSLNPYFLTFAPQGKKRVSYASSFGINVLPDASKKYYKEKLQNLDFIGVREDRGAEIVKKLTQKNAKVVLDPTLLLTEEEWQVVEKPVEGISGKYLLIYELKKNNYLCNLAKTIAKMQGLQIVRLCSNVMPVEKKGEILNITTAGPGAFIYLYRHASFVVTNSFHGTAFSVNFGKPFYSIVSRSKSNNNRQESLLKKCDLLDRLLYDDSPIPNDILSPINISNTKRLIAEMKRDSENYIKEALKV